MGFPLEEPAAPRDVYSLQVIVMLHLNRLGCERGSFEFFTELNLFLGSLCSGVQEAPWYVIQGLHFVELLRFLVEVWNSRLQCLLRKLKLLPAESEG